MNFSLVVVALWQIQTEVRSEIDCNREDTFYVMLYILCHAVNVEA